MVETEAYRRGQRLIQIRRLLGLSRLKFCERFGFANTTVAQWEMLSGVSPGINERHARRIIHAVEGANLVISEQWLLYGKGDPPYLLKPAEKPPLNLFHFACMRDELAKLVQHTLAELGPKFQAYQIPDDCMLPDFVPGDMVIAIIAEHTQWLDLFNNKPCLITQNDGSQLVRIFREIAPSHYLLLNSNPRSTQVQPTVVNARIQTIGQIVIHYRWGQI